VECFAYDDGGQEVSFIHSYSTSAGPTPTSPKLRQAPIILGCPEDASAPYFNLNGGCVMSMSAKVDFAGVTGNPTAPPKNGGVCADVTSNVGTITYDGGTSSSWTINLTPPDASTSTGRYPIILGWRRYRVNNGNGNCGNNVDASGTLGTAGAPYVADEDSGPVQYLTVTYGGSPANSIDQPTDAHLEVTVGLSPPLEDVPPPMTDPPVAFRLGAFNTPSQTQALDCLTHGASGWREKIVNGCQGFSVNERNGTCTTPYPNPSAPDCIDSQNGKFDVKDAYTQRFIPDGCAENPNNWNRNGFTLPPIDDPRWAQLFVVDRKGFTSPGKKTYPIRRFINVYVTAGDGLGCSDDDSAGQPVARNELWGHVTTYTTIDPDAVPGQTQCSFREGDVCVPVLVK
jgi:hypothetical protein